jgi:actinorhodin biosynthesis protein ActVIA
METTVITNSDLRVRVEDFYARQMQALDEGRYEQFADSFTPEGVFSHHPASPVTFYVSPQWGSRPPGPA